MKHFLIIWIVLVSNVADLKSAEASERALKAYYDLCNGVDEKAIQFSGDPNDIDERMLSLTMKSHRETENRSLEKIFSDISKMSESDRVVAVALMLESRSVDFVKIRQLLNFTSKDHSIESKRLAFEAQLDFLSGQVESGLKKLDVAVSNVKEYEPSILAFALALKAYALPATDGSLDKYETLINTLPDTDPFKPNLKAQIAILKNSSQDGGQLLKWFEEAYNKCKRDQTLALDYASALMQQNRSAEAQGILENLVLQYPDSYSPYVDFLLAHIYLAGDKLEHANAAVERARTASVYFDLTSKLRTNDMHSDLQKRRQDSVRNYQLVTYGFAALSVILTAVIILQKRKRA